MREYIVCVMQFSSLTAEDETNERTCSDEFIARGTIVLRLIGLTTVVLLLSGVK